MKRRGEGKKGGKLDRRVKKEEKDEKGESVKERRIARRGKYWTIQEKNGRKEGR